MADAYTDELSAANLLAILQGLADLAIGRARAGEEAWTPAECVETLVPRLQLTEQEARRLFFAGWAARQAYVYPLGEIAVAPPVGQDEAAWVQWLAQQARDRHDVGG